MLINEVEAVEELHTILDFLRWAVSCFEAADIHLGHGTDNAWDEALALILPSLHLPLTTEAPIIQARLTRSERQFLASQIKRRVEERIPTAYLTHSSWFGELEFYVDDRVLIPRSPFAEFLRDHVPNWFDEAGPESILELCTGSGCIAILAALNYPQAEVTASDISPDALEVARKNRSTYQLDDSLELLESDLFAGIPERSYDLIISNPPYVNYQEMASLPAEYQYEPTLALAADDDGLAIVIEILRQASAYLSDEGLLVLEVGSAEDALQARYPDVPFLWLEFEHGGQGVFALTASQLKEYQNMF